MLLIPYSAALSFRKRPFVTYAIVLLCLFVYYAQFNNNIKINHAVDGYCNAMEFSTSETTLDFIGINKQRCVDYLTLLHERYEHGVLEIILQEIRDKSEKYYSEPQLVEVSKNFVRHLTAFRKHAPASLDGAFMNFPNEFNPLTMLTSSIAHASWSHVIFNLIFFMAFAPAVETIINNRLKFVAVLIGIAVVTSIAYSVTVFLSRSYPAPTLGLSGVVMAMIGMSAYLMPHAKIRVFFWFFTLIRTFHVSAWILAAWYIGWDALDMLFSDDYGGTNLVAHVSGGVCGYLIAYFYLKDRRDEVKDELADEVEYIRSSRTVGSFDATYSGGRTEIHNKMQQKQFTQDYDAYISRVHRLVRINQHSQAIALITDDYELQSASVEIYQQLFYKIQQWGDSKTLLCVGRLLINLLIENRKYARALMFVELCQQVTADFVVADPVHVMLLARMARDNKQYKISLQLVSKSFERYGDAVDSEQASLFEVELLWHFLNLPDQANARMKVLLATAGGDFKVSLLNLAKLMQVDAEK